MPRGLGLGGEAVFWGAAGSCGDLADGEWAGVGGLLPPERGRWARPAGDNRRFLNGRLDVLRVGGPWRDRHERDGKWNSACVRFWRWAEPGVWDALVQTRVGPGLTDIWPQMIDSASVRAQVSAAGAKAGSSGSSWSLTRRLYEHNPRPM
ncbi:transposase [Thermaurantiacus sp.]